MEPIDKDSLKSNIIKMLGISGEEYLLPTERALWNVINDEPPVQPEILANGEGELNVPDINVGDMISRQAATTIPVMPKEHRHYQTNNLDDAYEQGWNDLQECIENLPSVQPTNEMLERCRFEYIHACKIVSIPTPDVTGKDIQDAYAVIKALQPIFGDVPFAIKRGDSDADD